MGYRYIVERHGGMAGIRASGTVDSESLNLTDRETMERLLDGDESLVCDPGADRYTYLVTREAVFGRTTREIPESRLPESVARAVTIDV